MIDLSKELEEVTKLRVGAHLSMRYCKSPEVSQAMAKLFLIEDNWGFWETIRRNRFWKHDFWDRLVNYYDAIQKWYNTYSKQERGKDEWPYFGEPELPWLKEKISFNVLIK